MILFLIVFLFQHTCILAETNSLRIRKNGLLLQEYSLPPSSTTNPSFSNPYSYLKQTSTLSPSSPNPTTISSPYPLTPTPSPTPEPTSSTTPSASPYPTNPFSWSPYCPTTIAPTSLKRNISLPPSSHQKKGDLLKSALRKPIK